MSIFTKKGRIEHRMKRRSKRRSARKDFKRLRKDYKRLLHDRDEEQADEEQTKQAVAILDADETEHEFIDRIDLFIDTHELIREMMFFADTESYRAVQNLELLQRKIQSYLTQHQQDQQTLAMAEELNKLMNAIHEKLRDAKRNARDVMRDHERLRDKSWFSDERIEHKLRRFIRKGKREASHVKKLNGHIGKILGELEKKGSQLDKAAIDKALQELHHDLQKDQKEIMDEIDHIVTLEHYLIVFEFRDSIDKLDNVIAYLEQQKFPQDKLMNIKRHLADAKARMEQLYKEEKIETKVLYKESNNRQAA